MRLLKEMAENISVSKQDNNGNKQYVIEGIFLQSEIVNKNGRKYPKAILDAEVNRYIEEYVKDKRAWGELCHVDSPIIDLNRVSHLITELKQDGNNWIGRAIITDSVAGKNVKALLDVGGKLGVSSRGLGSVKKVDGVNVVQDDFKLVTAADIVAVPSAPDAFVDAVMENAIEWYCDANGNWFSKFVEETQKEIHNTPKAQLEEKFLSVYEKFLRELVRSK